MVDLVEQWYRISQKLEADWDLVSDVWMDSVHDDFQKWHIEKMKDSINAYLQGDYGGIAVRGYGLIDLLQIIEETGEKISDLTGMAFDPSNPEGRGNEYIHLGEPLLEYDDNVKKKFRDDREDDILANESDDILREREHPRF